MASQSSTKQCSSVSNYCTRLLQPCLQHSIESKANSESLTNMQSIAPSGYPSFAATRYQTCISRSSCRPLDHILRSSCDRRWRQALAALPEQVDATPHHRATGCSAATHSAEPSSASALHTSRCSGRLLQNRLLSVLSGAVVAAAGVSAVPVWAPAAHAHIPTEAVLNNNRGGEGGFSRSELTALQQLAAPPTAIVTPAGRPPPRNVEAEWPFESRPAAAPGDSSGAGTDGGGSGGGSGGGGGGRASLPPGTVVGTPNYLARDGGAGRLPGGAAAAAAAGRGGNARCCRNGERGRDRCECVRRMYGVGVGIPVCSCSCW